MKRIFGLSIIPLNTDAGLLFLRISLSFLMIRFHGWGKFAGWQNGDDRKQIPNLFSVDGVRKEFHTFPDYIGISSELSYILVTWLETFGSMAILLGLFTRIQSLGLVIAMTVAFVFHHELSFQGGQTAFHFSFCYLLLFLAGPGKYSLDRRWAIGRS